MKPQERTRNAPKLPGSTPSKKIPASSSSNAAASSSQQPLKTKTKTHLKRKVSSTPQAASVASRATQFPARDLFRAVFCCPMVMLSPYKGNTLAADDYTAQVDDFIGRMRDRDELEEVTRVMDHAWEVLKRADFILELKRGVTTDEENEEGNEKQVTTYGAGRYFVLEDGDWVEVMINDGAVSLEFENVLGVYRELACADEDHELIVYHLEVWEGSFALEKYKDED